MISCRFNESFNIPGRAVPCLFNRDGICMREVVNIVDGVCSELRFRQGVSTFEQSAVVGDIGRNTEILEGEAIPANKYYIMGADFNHEGENAEVEAIESEKAEE